MTAENEQALQNPLEQAVTDPIEQQGDIAPAPGDDNATESTEATQEQQGAADKAATEDNTVQVQLGDDEEEEDDFNVSEETPEFVKKARDKYKEARAITKENQKLKARLAEMEATNRQPANDPMMEPEPTLEQFDYDEGQYKAAVREWTRKKVAVEAKDQEIQQAFIAKVHAYQQGVNALNANDKTEIIALTQGALSQAQMAIIVEVANDPALVVYTLGKNPGELEKIAKTGYIHFAAKVAQLEGRIKVKTPIKKPSSLPEKTIAGGGQSGTADTELARLEAEADKTGDRTAVIAYKRRKQAS